MSEDEPTEKERVEAEALARALENESGEGAPADALETAALLRHGALSDLAERRISSRVGPPVTKRRSALWWALAGAAILLLLCGRIFLSSSATTAATALPKPSGELLAAQASAATDAPAVARLDREMRGYRGALFDVLAARYER